MEEEKAPETTPAATDFELAHDYKLTQDLTQEEARREIAKTNENLTHAYWEPGHRHHNEAVSRMTRLYKIKTPEHTPVPGEISKAMELKAAGISEKDLQASDEAMHNLRDQEEYDLAIKPLKSEWGSEFDRNMELVREVVKLAPPEQRRFLDDAEDDVSALGNDPAFARALLVVGNLIQAHEAKLEASRKYKSQINQIKGKK